jgi:alginate O-acetyltransferase complex protein AlgI
VVFNSVLFFAFFAVVLAIHNGPFSWTVKKLNLILASSLFYAAWNPKFLVLLWVSMVTDYLVAGTMARTSSSVARRTLLFVSLAVNLGMLSIFKYGDFIARNFAHAAHLLGMNVAYNRFSIVLPVGISFYTFETISYTIDVYLRREKPWRSFMDFAVFLTFFPHLVAGPIVRPRDFLPQCQSPRRASRDQLAWGLILLLIGLFEKVVIADGLLAPIVDRVFAAHELLRFRDSWGGALAFSGQIFCDFAGYSSCAIGVALCFGFELPDNFLSPYAALGFSDFWRRWHISLSSWLRDYLYIPLGGNRKGRARTSVNLFITMLLGGLWHGASWTFVAWGGLHGAYLTVERAIEPILAKRTWLVERSGEVAGTLLTFSLVCVAWVFFRAADFSVAFNMLFSMAGLGGRGAPVVLGWTDGASVIGICSGMLLLHRFIGTRPLSQFWDRLPVFFRGVLVAGMLVAVLTENGMDRVFIYFQF